MKTIFIILPYIAAILACGLVTAQGDECKKLLEKVNAERVKYGLQPLKENALLNKAAQKFAEELAAQKRFSHTGADGSQPQDRAKKEGFKGTAVGENLAGNQNVDKAHTALMNSPGHRANILNAAYNQVGIGATPDSRYGKLYVELFGKGPDSPVSGAAAPVPPPAAPAAPPTAPVPPPAAPTAPPPAPRRASPGPAAPKPSAKSVSPRGGSAKSQSGRKPHHKNQPGKQRSFLSMFGDFFQSDCPKKD